LQHAGIEGFLENRKEVYAQADDEAAMWREFVERWWEAHGNQPVTVKELYNLCEEKELMTWVRGDHTERSQQCRLGRALKSARDRVIAGYRLRTAYAKNATGNRVNGYQLCEMPEHQESQDQVEIEPDGLDLAVPF
ncbi:hypothetical protein DRH29_04075, partial [candidate division Kazan bacterium]